MIYDFGQMKPRTNLTILVVPLLLPFLAVSDGMSHPEKGDIIIPSIEFADTPIQDAIDFLAQRSQELDASTDDPKAKGVNIVLVNDETLNEKTVTLKVTNIALVDALQFVADLVDGELKNLDHAIAITPRNHRQAVTKKEDADEMAEKIDDIVIPSIEFHDTPLKDALDFLRQRAIELDADSPKEKKGVNIVLKPAEENETVSVRLRNIPVGDAVILTALSAGYNVEIRRSGLFLSKVVMNQQPRRVQVRP